MDKSDGEAERHVAGVKAHVACAWGARGDRQGAGGGRSAGGKAKVEGAQRQARRRLKAHGDRQGAGGGRCAGGKEQVLEGARRLQGAR